MVKINLSIETQIGNTEDEKNEKGFAMLVDLRTTFD